jgi:disulfide bond formation protein DsbB
MTCPRCSADFGLGGAPDACPKCGAQILRKVTGVMKTSSVMIASGDERSFYPSVQDVPEPLRSQLIQSTQSENSGTILIADRAGKDQITKVIARRESAKERKALAAKEPDVVEAPKVVTPSYLDWRVLGLSWVVWVGLVMFLMAAGLICVVFGMRG